MISSALTPCSSAVRSRVPLPATCMARFDTTPVVKSPEVSRSAALPTKNPIAPSHSDSSGASSFGAMSSPSISA